MFEPYLAISASAGSGKTYALSVRYISLLYLGAHPSKILTLTFTNKAANEMKVRIFEVLANLEHRNELKDIAAQVGVSEEEILARKEQILSKFLNEELFISTLDSFFASILRKFALHVGLMPDFAIESSIFEKGVLEKFLQLCKQEEKYHSLIQFALSEDKKLSSIFTLLDSFYAKEGEFDANLFSKQRYKNPQRFLDLASELVLMLADNKAPARAAKLFSFSDIDSAIGKGVFEKASLYEHSYTKKYTTDSIDAKFQELKHELRDYIQAREKYLLGELGNLYALYKKTLKAINQEKNILSFSDVASLLYELLQNEISREFLYFRLDGKIEHILIDEYQDTNVLQYKILEPLMQEIVSGIGVKEFKSLFFVGDVKQSIYRFRGGSKKLFAHTIKEFGVKREVLDTNYRSEKNVVLFVNDTFKNLIEDYEIQKVNAKEEGFVKVVIDDEIEKQILQNVHMLLDAGIEQKDIAILVHQNKDASYLQELLEEELDVKVQTEASLKLINVPLIGAILDLMKYAYFGDKLFLENFLAVVGEDFRQKIDVSFIDTSLSPLRIVKQIVKRFKLFADDMDIIKLIEVAKRYEDIESFLFESESFSEEAKSEDNDGIKVLTIHKSKGLEFEHVLVVDRFKSPKNNTNTLMYEYEDVRLKALFQRVKGREYVDETYAKAKEKEGILEKEDKLNMYYVAFTRAQSSLIVCSKEKASAFVDLALENVELGSLHVKPKEEIKTELHVMKTSLQNYGFQEKQKSEVEKKEYDAYSVEYGLALHYCLELMKDFDEKSLKSALQSVYNRYLQSLSEEAIKSIYHRILKFIEDPIFQELIKNGKLYKEQPLIYNGERKQLDLLVEKDEKIIVIDYKSSQRVWEEHKKQVSFYIKALESIYSKPVQGYLCYLKEDNTEIINL
jgi:exodeoxyribonuclease V beta subunit